MSDLPPTIGPGSPSAPDASASDTPAERAWRGAEMWWYAALAVVFGVVALAGLAAAAAVSPTSCSLCHSQQVAALDQGGHVGVHCDSCHVTPGPFGLVDNRLQVAAMVPAQLIPGGSPRATIDNGACLRCHEPMINQTVVVDGVRMNHRAPTDQGWLCTSCHSSVGHGGSDVRSFGDYTMDTCLACHVQNAENVSGCATCHEEGSSAGRSDGAPTPWRVAHGANWRQTHGMGDLGTCKACHASGYCSACHVIEFPHPDSFLGKHGEVAISSDEAAASCADCHSQVTCDGCHGLSMPHPDDFMPDHPDLVAEEGAEVCNRCHDSSNCDECHTRHAHPGLDPDVLRQLRARPAGVR